MSSLHGSRSVRQNSPIDKDQPGLSVIRRNLEVIFVAFPPPRFLSFMAQGRRRLGVLGLGVLGLGVLDLGM